MQDSELQQIVTRLLTDPACSICPASRSQPMPEFLPEDARQFFEQCSGGRLYYDAEYPTPQFGCVLRFDDQPVSNRLPCEGAEFDSLYVVAEFEEGDYDCVAVSARPETFGHIYRLDFALGNPPLTAWGAQFMAPTFTRWLEIHLEAWDVYQDDWREGLRHFAHLIEDEYRQRT